MHVRRFPARTHLIEPEEGGWGGGGFRWYQFGEKCSPPPLPPKPLDRCFRSMLFSTPCCRSASSAALTLSFPRRCALCRSNVEWPAVRERTDTETAAASRNNRSKCRNCWRAVCDDCVGTFWPRDMVPPRPDLSTTGWCVRSDVGQGYMGTRGARTHVRVDCRVVCAARCGSSSSSSSSSRGFELAPRVVSGCGSLLVVQAGECIVYPHADGSRGAHCRQPWFVLRCGMDCGGLR